MSKRLSAQYHMVVWLAGGNIDEAVSQVTARKRDAIRLVRRAVFHHGVGAVGAVYVGERGGPLLYQVRCAETKNDGLTLKVEEL